MMPNMTGFELIQKLKENPETKNIPVMVSSHLGRESDRQEAEKLGARAFVVKGRVTPKHIADMVLHILCEKKYLKIFRVAISLSELDAPQFAQEVNMDGKIILELTESTVGLSKEFHAKPISADRSSQTESEPKNKPEDNFASVF
jgi:CheY-like chemotaxis protein